LFPSRWKNYSQVPFLAFDVQNRSDKPVQCEWEVTIPAKMDAPTRGEVALRPKEEKTIYVTAAFSEEFYGNEQDVFTAGEINVKYQENRQVKRERNEFQAFIYGRNAIDWEQDVGWIASFINPQDRLIRSTASAILDINRDLVDAQSAAANLEYGMVIFNSLKDMGINYLPDPNTPYGLLEERQTYIDDVQFPVELLTSRAGDCDDLTALMCALLESVGIETVILDVPGHLYFMFDAGVMPIYAMTLMVDEELLVEHDQRLFVPVEVTEIQSGFLEAWREGAAQYARWSELEELRQISLHDSWVAYPPVPLTIQTADRSVSVPVSATARAEAARFHEMQQAYLNDSYLNRIRAMQSAPDSMNALALKLLFAGEITEAETLLRQAVAYDSAHVGVLNNLAGVLSLQGKEEEAERLFDRIAVLGGPLPQEIAKNWVLFSFMSAPLPAGEARMQSLRSIREDLPRFGSGIDLEAEFEQIRICLQDSGLPSENLVECISLALRGILPVSELRDRLHEKGQAEKGKVGWMLWYGVDFEQ
jgi:hypothetical protein